MDQALDCGIALVLPHGIFGQGRTNGLHSLIGHFVHIGRQPILKLRLFAVGRADICNMLATALQQMVNRQPRALDIVAFHRNKVFFARAPADHWGLAPRIFTEKLPALDILSAADDDEAIGLPAARIVGKEVVGGVLKRDNQIITAFRCRCRDATEQRQIKRVDIRFVLAAPTQNDERDGIGLLCAQAKGIMVNGIIELIGQCDNTRPRGFADFLITT